MEDSLNSSKLHVQFLSSCTEISTGQATRPRLCSHCATFVSVVGREEKGAERNKHHLVLPKPSQCFPSLQSTHLFFKTTSEEGIIYAYFAEIEAGAGEVNWPWSQANT